MESREITLETGDRRGLADVTDACERFLADIGATNGLLNVFVPHATAGLAIMELGSGSDEDLMASLDRLLPGDDRWRHAHGSPGHGADHVLPALIAPSVTVPVVDARLALGRWQSIALVDPNRDNPRRTVRLTYVAG